MIRCYGCARMEIRNTNTIFECRSKIIIIISHCQYNIYYLSVVKLWLCEFIFVYIRYWFVCMAPIGNERKNGRRWGRENVRPNGRMNGPMGTLSNILGTYRKNSFISYLWYSLDNVEEHQQISAADAHTARGIGMMWVFVDRTESERACKCCVRMGFDGRIR